MESKNKNMIVYGIIAVIVIVAAAFVLTTVLPSTDSIALHLYASNSTAVYPYQTSYFEVLVNNTGGNQVNNLLVGFYLNGTEVRHYTVNIPAHKGILLGANYTYSVNGTYPFKAVADPSHVLSVVNRSGMQQSVVVKVIQNQVPNVYTSIPNTNITSSQSFTFSSAGTLSVSAIADQYNISSLNGLFGQPQDIMVKIFENLYGYIAFTNGAYAHYSDNSSAYTAWLQGTVTPSLVNYVISSYHLPQANISVNGTSIYFTKASNQTSVCVFYQNGWTKIVSYYNNSKAGTCALIAGNTYQPTESNTLVGALKLNTNLTHYQSGFIYKNSSLIGSSVSYGANSSLQAMNIFQNDYGFFSSLVKTNNPEINITNMTGKCVGLIADINSTHICSIYVLTKSGSVPANYSMINTTLVTKGFTFDLYSLVNVSDIFSAHENGASLLNALEVNQSTLKWSSGFKNSCGFNTTSPSFGCAVNNFNYTNDFANVTLTNMLNGTVKLNTAACYMPGTQHNMSINQTLKLGGNSTVVLQCFNIPIPEASAVTSYGLSLNYTYNGAAKTIYGLLNATNFGYG